MPAQPIVPSNKKDPTGALRKVAGSQLNFAKRLDLIYRNIKTVIEGLSYQTIEVSSSQAFVLHMQPNESLYQFELSSTELSNLSKTIADMIDRIILDGGEFDLWFMKEYVKPAYQQGTAQTYANLSAQSVVYSAARPMLESVLLSQAYQLRIGFVAARQFENMEGFSDSVKREARRVLSDGIARGLNPRVIARQLQDRLDVTRSRANTIARTEITQALKAARMAESEQASIDFNIITKQLWVSALAAGRTRPHHAARHGKLYTTTQIREFYAKNGNAINCLCTCVEQIVDAEGEPITTGSIDKLEKQREEYGVE